MIQIMNARERTFADVQKIFAQADPRFRLKQWGEAGGPPSSGEFLIPADLAGEYG
jgi:hypothetical protein